MSSTRKIPTSTANNQSQNSKGPIEDKLNVNGKTGVSTSFAQQKAQIVGDQYQGFNLKQKF